MKRVLKILVFLVPLLLFAGFVALGFSGLQHEKRPIVGHIGKPMPVFALQPLDGKDTIASKDMKGRWLLVNFFASWCAPCRAELDVMKAIRSDKLHILGIAYRDKPEATRTFLAELNPYDAVGLDPSGMNAIEWGLTGVPETFLVSPEGMIVAHIAGPLTEAVWRQDFVVHMGDER